jgi:hypothetical protein
VTNIEAGTIIIIDGKENSIIKTVFLGKRPFKMSLINKSRIYVPCDRENNISIFDFINDNVERMNIPNNGVIEIDRLNEFLFVSDTNEIGIYELSTGKRIKKIEGFWAVSGIKLNKDMSKLYVLDKLLRELRVYSTSSFKLLYKIDNIGINPGPFLIEDNTVYIAVEGYKHEEKSSYIIKIETESHRITKLPLAIGSLIGHMAVKGNKLYATNITMNRIEVIDIKEFKVIKSILSSLPQPTGLNITDRGDKLLVANRNCGGYGGIDIIDLSSNSLIKSVTMNSSNTQPYDVIEVSFELPVTNDLSVTLVDSNAVREIDGPSKIITKRESGTYNKNIKFSNVSVKLSNNEEAKYRLQQIEFKNGFIVNNSEISKLALESSSFFRTEFKIRIPYIIYYVDELGKQHRYESFLEKVQDVILTLPDDYKKSKYEFKPITISDILFTPRLVNNIAKFDVRTHLTIKIIEMDEINVSEYHSYLQSINEDNYTDNTKGEFQPFFGYKTPLFLQDIVFLK